MIAMCGRVEHLKTEMRDQGLYIQAADCPVRIGDEQRSVDVRLWSSYHSAEAILETKWTRGPIARAMARAEESIPMLRKACQEGRWTRSKARVKASVVGVLVVRPGSWSCVLSQADGSHCVHYPVEQRIRPKKRSGASLSGFQKRSTNAHLYATEKLRRKIGLPKKTTRAYEEAYRRTAKGKAVRAAANRRYYQKSRK